MIESAYGGLMNYNELIAWVEEATALLRPSTYSSSEQVDGRLLLHFLRLFEKFAYSGHDVSFF